MRKLDGKIKEVRSYARHFTELTSGLSFLPLGFSCPLVFRFPRSRSLTLAQLQDAVTVAHETSTAFSDEVIKEHSIFELSKKEEMKELLQNYADGQVELFQRVGPPNCL